MSTVNTKHIDRTILAVSKLGLFCMGELKLNEETFDAHVDTILAFLEETNNHRYRFGTTIPRSE